MMFIRVCTFISFRRFDITILRHPFSYATSSHNCYLHNASLQYIMYENEPVKLNRKYTGWGVYYDTNMYKGAKVICILKALDQPEIGSVADRTGHLIMEVGVVVQAVRNI